MIHVFSVTVITTPTRDSEIITDGVSAKTGTGITPSDTPMKIQQAAMNTFHLILSANSMARKVSTQTLPTDT